MLLKKSSKFYRIQILQNQAVENNRQQDLISESRVDGSIENENLEEEEERNSTNVAKERIVTPCPECFTDIHIGSGMKKSTCPFYLWSKDYPKVTRKNKHEASSLAHKRHWPLVRTHFVDPLSGQYVRGEDWTWKGPPN